MNKYYYKVRDEHGGILGIASSASLVYYNEKVDRLLGCDETLAQYICVNDKFYRIGVFANENPKMAKRFPEAFVELTTKEDYLNFLDKNRKAKWV